MQLSAPQGTFLNGLFTKFRAYVGGFGSGKTFVGCIDLLNFAQQHPGCVQGYFGPTYPAIRDIFYPTLVEAAEMLGLRLEIKETNKEVAIYRGRLYYGTIICRSMDKPNSIIGFKIARALVDEIDTLPKDKAKNAWDKIIARLRLKIKGVENSIGVTTTPEGFLFVYETFARDPSQSYSMVQASSYENEEFLPDDYIPSLLETYTPELVQAYVGGNFVNLTSGSVYTAYDRLLCHSSEKVKPKELLCIGQDFNVNKMASVVYVIRGEGVWHAVDEFSTLNDTPHVIDTLQKKYPDHPIRIYPDASGQNTSSKNASESDLSLLEAAGFSIYANKKNPFIKDRVTAMNQAFIRGRLRVNEVACPEYAKCLEQQAYNDNGEPDKKNGLDHMNDAGGYPIAFTFPVVKPASRVKVKISH